MSLDPTLYQQRLEKRISLFSGRFMSDSKWVKLFTVLSNEFPLVKKCLIKDVMDSHLREMEVPAIDKFLETFHNKGIKDVMSGGPSQFKSIESIEFPAVWEVKRKMRTQVLDPIIYRQDIFQIKNILDAIGQLETFIDNDKLIVYGYR
ncbi:MAG: hypothetical protein V4592_03845 [Bacteroidota bacterium]